MRHALIPSLSLALLLGLAACGSEVADATETPSDTTQDTTPVDTSDPAPDTDPEPEPQPVNPDQPVVTPEDPGTADVSFAIDSTQGELDPISPWIYGGNDRSSLQELPEPLTFARFGGNRLSAFNWENNASNAGSDYNHQNDSLLGGGDAPGGAVARRLDAAAAKGAAALLTIPMLDYVAADKAGDGDVANSANYLQTRFKRNASRKDGALSFPPEVGDDVVYQDEFVAWVEGQYPDRPIFYSMDNEPALWDHTHSRIHPNPVTYQELVDRTTEYATMVKDVAGDDAKVFGGVFFGWNGMKSLRNAPDAGGRDFIEFLLAEMKKQEDAQGRRIMDVLDFHWYPEAQGGGQRILNISGGADSSEPAVAEARMQAPRSLWDPTYVEQSWIANDVGNQPIALLPRLQEKIDRNYPGTRMAITEYYYGGGEHISGGIAEADVLGIFGREGVFAANFWHLGRGDHRYIYAALEMYRNFDGQGGAFGNLSVPAETDDIAGTSVYASVDTEDPDRMVVVAINKTGQPQTAGLRVTHRGEFSRAEVYQLTSSAAEPVRADDLESVGVNAFAYTMPAHSVSTLVLTR